MSIYLTLTNTWFQVYISVLIKINRLINNMAILLGGRSVAIFTLTRILPICLIMFTKIILFIDLNDLFDLSHYFATYDCFDGYDLNMDPKNSQSSGDYNKESPSYDSGQEPKGGGPNPDPDNTLAVCKGKDDTEDNCSPNISDKENALENEAISKVDPDIFSSKNEGDDEAVSKVDPDVLSYQNKGDEYLASQAGSSNDNSNSDSGSESNDHNTTPAHETPYRWENIFWTRHEIYMELFVEVSEAVEEFVGWREGDYIKGYINDIDNHVGVVCIDTRNLSPEELLQRSDLDWRSSINTINEAISRLDDELVYIRNNFSDPIASDNEDLVSNNDQQSNQSSRNSIGSNNNQSRGPSSKNSSRDSSPGSGRSNNSSGWNN